MLNTPVSKEHVHKMLIGLNSHKATGLDGPQGSILGPLLFLVYVNDMKAAVKCKLLLYADDSALLVSGKDVLEIERILSVELGAVNEWLCENRLSLHLGKTQSVNADRSDNDETLLLPNFIKLTKTRQQNEEYDMVKLQVKTDNIQ